jgi:hypothetical protein
LNENGPLEWRKIMPKSKLKKTPSWSKKSASAKTAAKRSALSAKAATTFPNKRMALSPSQPHSKSYGR